MDIYLDSANYEKITEYVEAYNIKGVTSNPTIIVKDKADILKLVEIVPKHKDLFVQVISDEVEGIITETKKLMSLSNNIIVKIPASPNGLKAIKLLKDEGIKTLATGIYSVQQAIMAANCGAAYVAPYVNRICDLEIDGVKAALEIQKTFRTNNTDCKVLAASFKNMMQVKELMINGIDAVTVSVDLMEKLIHNKNTDYAVKDFVTAWKNYTGNDTLCL
ncbi:transaldolase family protein [Clostridium sp. MD294]|uniref:transaldolase family protein n=1 Tax=Clostridium sp. MD294 TaxID=97138 RepID=UPI0002C9B1AD|nr:transaldolase family protein [Clostridium sp. MD294]USF29242.1 Transaldolase [Clostridium sp. MD294]